ncbi:MAG: 16S rRNA (cytosine(1402)-N(4))-methyltransferase RsmH [Deltaproteobacteria bacterium]|nr:16S rRNA (cytosine(1402)-N(4))-methyltransferase RsmH [Deltaproteobacteria bacterium]
MVVEPRVNPAGSEPDEGSAFVHESVLVAEVLETLSPRDGEVFVDGTLGGGGHSSALLTAAPGITLVGIDRDPDALAAARARLGEARASLVHGQYSEIADVLSTLGIERVDGILLDLGVSSPQLDRADRGFSFTRPGPLDMRMDPTRGPTVLELLRITETDDLANLIHELGEERHSRKIARLIHEALAADTLQTTTDLAAVIARGIPIIEQRKSKIHPATRTFQALRIAVNAELAELEHFLAVFPDLLAPGGRCAIISFHSLEDRLVKNRFRDLGWTSSLPDKFAAQAGERTAPVCEPITRKAVFASDAEVERNPRARSARLRACRRTAAPNVLAIRPPG